MAATEIVSAAVLLQLAHPGAPVLGFLLLPVHADPRPAGLATAPLNHSGLLLPTELMHHLGLPAMIGYAGTNEDRRARGRPPPG